jgi:Fe2+ or Zn2+ uptake regulation protein
MNKSYIERSEKIEKLYLKILAGVIFTDHEALPQYFIISYIEASCKHVGEIVKGYNVLKSMEKHGIIKPSNAHGEETYYTHNLPRTLQANFPNHITCKNCNDAKIPNRV